MNTHFLLCTLDENCPADLPPFFGGGGMLSQLFAHKIRGLSSSIKIQFMGLGVTL